MTRPAFFRMTAVTAPGVVKHLIGSRRVLVGIALALSGAPGLPAAASATADGGGAYASAAAPPPAGPVSFHPTTSSPPSVTVRLGVLQMAGGPAHELHGAVVEAGGSRPLASAVVRLDGADVRTTLTGSDGRWRLAGLPDGEYTLQVQNLGYASRSIPVRLPRDAAAVLTIELVAQPIALDAVVVTASRRPQRLAEVAVTTELITHEELARSGAADLSTVLAERTGIQLSGGRPFGEGVMLQGFSSERVLVLVDGQPLVGRVAGTLDVSRIPLSSVDRVEVVKGSQSALYGTDAMGGVINIITRRPLGIWAMSADAVVGTAGRMDTSVGFEGAIGDVAAIGELGRRATETVPGRSDQTAALSQRHHGSTTLRWELSPAWTVEANARAFEESQRWRTGQLFYFVDNSDRGGRVTATRAGSGGRFSSTLYASSFSHLFRRALTERPAGAEGEDESQRLVRGEVLLNVEGAPIPLDLGVDVTREVRASERIASHRQTIHTVAPFGQATLSSGPVELVAGVRLTWSQQWGTAWTPRVAAAYRPVATLALRASAGRGYRAPSFEELYLEFMNVGPGFGYMVRGNPDLDPERSTSLSAGAEWILPNGFVRMQLFENRFSDFIENHLAGGSNDLDVYTYSNVARGLTRGAEFEAAWMWRHGRVDGGYGYVHARDLDGDQPLLGHPGHTGRLGVQQDLPLGVRASVTGVYTGGTPLRQSEARSIATDGFVRLDARLTRSFSNRLELSVGGRNLFDSRPDDWPGFAGRHLYIGASWRGR